MSYFKKLSEVSTFIDHQAETLEQILERLKCIDDKLRTSTSLTSELLPCYAPKSSASKIERTG